MAEQGKAAATATPKTAAATAAKKHRSPNYPLIGLRKAVERVGKLYEKHKKNWMPVPVAHEFLGYKKNSGVAKQVAAALKAYGLIDLQGDGEKAEMRISDRAYRVILNHADREGLLRAAALGPSLHGELWKKYGDEGLPPDETVRHFLVFDRSFNPESVDGFIAQFKDTLAFSKLDASGKLAGAETTGEDAGGDEHEDENPGDVMTAVTENPKPDRGQKDPAPPPPAGSFQDVYTAGAGPVVVRWPGVVTADEAEDLDAWLDMIKRKIKRAVKGQQN